jgi:hypothetical protein
MLQCCLFKALRISYFARVGSSSSCAPRVKSLSCPLQFARAFVTAASFVLDSHFILSPSLARAFRRLILSLTQGYSSWASLGSFIPVAASPPAALYLARLRVARAAAKALQTLRARLYFVCIALALCCLARGIDQSPAGSFLNSPRWQHRLPPPC